MQNQRRPSQTHLPAIHGACIRRYVHSYLVYSLARRPVFGGIASVFYLLQGCLRRAVELELEDVHMLCCLNAAVQTAVALILLDVGDVAAGDAEDEVERVGKVAFLFCLVLLAARSVWDAGEEGREERLLNLSSSPFFNATTALRTHEPASSRVDR